MHDHGADLARAEDDRLKEGERVAAVVVCHHVFGLGVYVDARDEYGHMDIPFKGPEDYPPIGAAVEASVFGYSGDQLRLALWVSPHAT
jgi:hypothetical protein